MFIKLTQEHLKNPRKSVKRFFFLIPVTQNVKLYSKLRTQQNWDVFGNTNQ